MVKLHILGALLLSFMEFALAQSARAYYVDMPLDHFSNDDTRTFRNRYYMNDTFYKPGGPVFRKPPELSQGRCETVLSIRIVYDAGEGSASLNIASLGRGASYDYARRFNGYLPPLKTPHEFWQELN